MSRNTSVILGNHFDEFIKKEIESGRYKSASEVIRSGLRILEAEKRKIELINMGTDLHPNLVTEKDALL